jgi:DNA-binding protein HU-beta
MVAGRPPETGTEFDERFVKAVAQRTGESRELVREVYDAIVDTLVDALATRSRVSIRRLGTFVRHRAPLRLRTDLLYQPGMEAFGVIGYTPSPHAILTMERAIYGTSPPTHTTTVTYEASEEVRRGLGHACALEERAEARRDQEMNKDAVVKAVSQGAGVTLDIAGRVINALTALARTELSAGRKFRIYGLGTFEPKTASAHQAVNPQTQEPVDVPERQRVTFHAQDGLLR